jgi:hypothetical protein
MPLPPMAGGAFGIASVFASEVRWGNGAWTVTNRRFDSAGAMHAANEFIWFHNYEVNGFPVVNGPRLASAPAGNALHIGFNAFLGHQYFLEVSTDFGCG